MCLLALGLLPLLGQVWKWGLSSQQSVQRYQTFLMMACTDKYQIAKIDKVAKIGKIAKLDKIAKLRVVNIS